MQKRYSTFKFSTSTILFFCLFIAQGAFAQANPCASQINLTCGVNSNYSISGAGAWNPTGPWGTPGEEQVFTYTPATSGAYSIQVTNNNYYVDLFYSTTCGASGWTYVSDIYTNEINQITLTAGVTYYFLIDDENTAVSSGFISINCPCIPPPGGIDATLLINASSMSYASSTAGACNDVSLRPSNDRVLQVEIICPGDYTFSLCNQANWDTYLYLTDQPSGGNTLAFNDDNCGLQSSITANLSVGLYYVTIEGYSSSSEGVFELDITTTCSFAPLPVELLYFTGENNDRKNHLNWHTVSELNNEYFILERSLDGSNFIGIGMVDGQGTTTDPMDYTFIDESFTSGVNYYRLIQVDLDGNKEIFNTIAISSNYDEDLTLFPNPAKNLVNINSKEELINPIISLKNAQGKIVSNEYFMSGNQFLIELDQVPGVYFVTIISNDQILTRKLVIH